MKKAKDQAPNSKLFYEVMDAKIKGFQAYIFVIMMKALHVRDKKYL
jgi:hypothetical protein